MKEQKDYIRDISEIRSMMERSSKFLSLSGLSGVMAGVYALVGAFIVYRFFEFNPDNIEYSFPNFLTILLFAISILVLAIGTAIFFSYTKADKNEEKIWNTTSRQLLFHMAVPLFAGGILIIVLISKGFIGLAAPLTLIFYGLGLFNAGKFTYEDVTFLGIIQVVLGLISIWFIEFSLVLWALGFGVVHVVYGMYIHFKYER